MEPDHAEDTVHLINLICAHLSQHAYLQAEPLLVRLVAHVTAQGGERPQLATVLASLATVRQGLGKHDLAEQLWRRALAIRERALAPNHFAIARNLEHLAEACAAQGKLQEALDLLRRALDIDEHTLSPTNASVAAVRAKVTELALLASQETLGHWAAPAASRARPLPTATSYPVFVSEHGRYGGEDEASRRPHVSFRTRWHRSLPRAALAACTRAEWRWPAAAAGAVIAILLLVPRFAPRGGVRPSLPPPPGAAAQPSGSRTDRVTAVTAEAAVMHRAAPRPSSIGMETGAVGAASAQTADPVRAARAAATIPNMNSRLVASAMQAAKRAAARQLTEDSGRIAEVVPATAGSARTGADAAMRLLVGGPANPGAAALSDGTRPAALAPDSPMPAYPPALWSAAISGKVLVELLVDSSGRADPATVEVLYSDHPQFTRAVRAALPAMRFIPAMADGHRQAQLLRLPFTFATEGNPR